MGLIPTPTLRDLRHWIPALHHDRVAYGLTLGSKGAAGRPPKTQTPVGSGCGRTLGDRAGMPYPHFHAPMNGTTRDVDHITPG